MSRRVCRSVGRRCWSVLTPVWLLLLATAAVAAPQQVIFPKPESARDQRVNYPVELLRLSLEKSGQPFVLRPSHASMQQGRSLRLLEAGRGIDVVWTVTTPEREQQLLPIRLPIDRGLIGWRLLLIRKPAAAAFAPPISAATLAPLRAGQGHDWPDLEVLRDNGFSVAANPSYDGLFEMLARDHIQYFPRSLAEIGAELDARPQLNLQIEPSIALHYPQALYFFVNKQQAVLANAIELGLRTAHADGSWQQLFNRHYAQAITEARLSERKIIELRNSRLPAATPLTDRALWLSPGEQR